MNGCEEVFNAKYKLIHLLWIDLPILLSLFLIKQLTTYMMVSTLGYGQAHSQVFRAGMAKF